MRGAPAPLRRAFQDGAPRLTKRRRRLRRCGSEATATRTHKGVAAAVEGRGTLDGLRRGLGGRRGGEFVGRVATCVTFLGEAKASLLTVERRLRHRGYSLRFWVCPQDRTTTFFHQAGRRHRLHPANCRRFMIVFAVAATRVRPPGECLEGECLEIERVATIYLRAKHPK
jgi:hypothetical protein